MDPQIKSIATSVLLAGATALTTWMVAHGLLSADQQSAIAQDLVGVVSAGLGAAVVWWKSTQHTQTNMIQEVNKADNGVKVVPNAVAAEPVNAPLKGPK
jgi:hypothetical protein